MTALLLMLTRAILIGTLLIPLPDMLFSRAGDGLGNGPTPQAGGSLAYGDTVTGTLDDANPEDRWTFTGQGGDTIRVITTRTVDAPGGLDGYLILLGPDGGTLAEVDDDDGDLMPRLEGFVLPADGDYTLVMTRFGFADGFSSGEYALALNKLDPQSPAVPTGGTRWIDPDDLPGNLRRIAYNAPVTGTISGADFDAWYLFRGGAGDVISVIMTAGAGGLDPYLILTDGDGYELASNDDAPGLSLDAAIVDFTLPGTGSYLIRATRYGFANGPTEGDYTLRIETDARALWSGDDPGAVIPLVFGQPTGGTLDSDHASARYTFSGSAGARITISVRRTDGTLAPALLLRGPDQTEIAFSRAWFTPGEARIHRLALPDDGLYRLDVLLDDLSTAGDYIVLLLADAPGSGPDSLDAPGSGPELDLLLTWESAADLDLAVSVPGGAISRAHDYCEERVATPSEHLTWERDSAMPGLYAITVSYRFDCAGTGEPVTFTLTIMAQGRLTDSVSAVLVRPGDSYTIPLNITR